MQLAIDVPGEEVMFADPRLDLLDSQIQTFFVQRGELSLLQQAVGLSQLPAKRAHLVHLVEECRTQLSFLGVSLRGDGFTLDIASFMCVSAVSGAHRGRSIRG